MKHAHTWIAAYMLLLLSSCAQVQDTFDFRAVQDQFDAAAKADNLGAKSDIAAPSGYADIASKLTEARIAKLDAKLQSNAWMMRSMAEWRTGKFLPAQDSANNGIRANPELHSRDHLLLLIVPALASDSQILDAWRKAGEAFTPDQYEQKAARDYPVVLRKLNEAQAQSGPNSDDSIKNLISFHKWRTLINWDNMINTMNADEATQDAAAAKAATHFSGISLAKMAKAARDSIPASDDYRKLIAAKPTGGS